jgi:predicted PurR-regulated permease PerM
MVGKAKKQGRPFSLREGRVTTFFLGILVLFASGLVLRHLQVIFKPLLIAVFLSLLFEPMVRSLMRWKIPKFFAFLISLLLVFAILWSLGLLIYASVASFVEGFPKYQSKFHDLYMSAIESLKIPHEHVKEYVQQIKWADVWENLSLTSFVTSTVGTFISFLTNLFFVLLFTIYIVLGKEHFRSKVNQSFPPERADSIADIFKNINSGVQKYLVTKLIVSLGTGILAAVILLIFGVDFALVWGLLTFLLNFIPNIGSVIATLPPILLAFLQYGSIFPGLWVAILLIGTQVTMGNIVEPRVVGKSLNLSPLVVIVSLVFWGFIWGPVGMVLAVPISSTIQIVCANIDSLRPISILMGGD